MDPADQVKVRADQGRMRLVKMEAIKPQVESAEESEVSDGLKPEGEAKHDYLDALLVLGALLFGISAMGIFMNRKKRAGIVDVYRADALGGELQLYRLLAIFRRYCRTNFSYSSY